jgi:hypothetical protein
MAALPSKPFDRPSCRFCGRPWSVPEGRRADLDFCPKCSSVRQSIAARTFGHRPLHQSDFDGNYLLPKRRGAGR